HRSPDLAVGQQNVGARDQQHDQQQQALRDHHDQRPEKAGPERACKKFGHPLTLTSPPSASCPRRGGNIPPSPPTRARSGWSDKNPQSATLTASSQRCRPSPQAS